MTYFRWQKGRQDTGYDKMCFISTTWPTSFDVYLLRFNPGQTIPPHTDKVGAGEHHRVNIIFKQAKQGGDFICKDPIYESKRIKYFRPDASEHSVTEIIQGRRYVLSIGWIQRTSD